MKKIILGIVVLLLSSIPVIADTAQQSSMLPPTTWEEFGYKGKVQKVTFYTVAYYYRGADTIPFGEIDVPMLFRSESREFFRSGRIRVLTYHSTFGDTPDTYTYDSKWHLLSQFGVTYVWENDLFVGRYLQDSSSASHRVRRYDQHDNLVEVDDYMNNETKPSYQWLLTYDEQGNWIREELYDRGILDSVQNLRYDSRHRPVETSRHMPLYGKLLLVNKDVYTYSGGVLAQHTAEVWEHPYPGGIANEEGFLADFTRTTYNSRGRKVSETRYWNRDPTVPPEQVLTKEHLAYARTYEYDADNRLFKETHDNGALLTFTYDRHDNLIQKVEYWPLGDDGPEVVVEITDYVITYFDSPYPVGTLRDGGVRIRLEPNLKGFVLSRLLQKGEKVRILDETPTRMKVEDVDAPWYQVATEDGLIGWVQRAFIDRQK